MIRGEHLLLKLSSEIAHFEQTKDKAEQARIVAELEAMIAFIEGAERSVKRELERTDLNILEKFNFESSVASAEILIKDLKAAEAKVKAVKVQ